MRILTLVKRVSLKSNMNGHEGNVEDDDVVGGDDEEDEDGNVVADSTEGEGDEVSEDGWVDNVEGLTDEEKAELYTCVEPLRGALKKVSSHIL